jgi:hypothetical protein
MKQQKIFLFLAAALVVTMLALVLRQAFRPRQSAVRVSALSELAQISKACRMYHAEF